MNYWETLLALSLFPFFSLFLCLFLLSALSPSSFFNPFLPSFITCLLSTSYMSGRVIRDQTSNSNSNSKKTIQTLFLISGCSVYGVGEETEDWRFQLESTSAVDVRRAAQPGRQAGIRQRGQVMTVLQQREYRCKRLDRRKQD